MADERVLALVETLQRSAATVEQELLHIHRDIETTTECLERYGDVYAPPLRYLHSLRENKKARFREIVTQVEGLKVQLDSSASLLATLNAETPLTLVTQLK